MQRAGKEVGALWYAGTESDIQVVGVSRRLIFSIGYRPR